MLGNTSLLLTPVSLGYKSNEQLAPLSDEEQFSVNNCPRIQPILRLKLERRIYFYCTLACPFN